jgi:dTDP-4-dehydrorhamnose reductase
VFLTKEQLPIHDREKVADFFENHSPSYLVNCAAYTAVDKAETDKELAFLINATGTDILAQHCQQTGCQFIHISTDYVFDGEKRDAYTEEDEARPISVYGESKREGERRALAANERALVVRVSWVFGPDRPSFVDWAIGQAREKEEVKAIADKWATPTYTLDLAAWLKPLLPGDNGLQELSGILHLANSGECSWQEYAQWALECCRAEGIAMKARKISAQSLSEMATFIAKRPARTVLSTAKYETLTGVKPRPWQKAVAEFVRDYKK